MAKKTEKNTHICSECIGEFDGKDLYEVLIESIIDPNCKYYTIFCEKCVKKLKFTNYSPYYKSKTKSTTEKTKKSTTEKTKKNK
jgi:hypothetical protein